MKIKPTLKKIADFSPFIAILILSLLPVFYTWGRIPIWGDTIIPLSSDGMKKYLYQWLPLQNGQYFAINYFPYFIFYKLIEIFTHNIYFISVAIIFLLKIIAGLGIYKLSKLLYSDKVKIPALYALPAIFYLLSPAQLKGSHYLYIYSFAPWFLYFIFKIVKSNKIKAQDLIWMSVILFFSSINLPNPKNIFHLFVISIIMLAAALIFKIINIRFFFKNFGKIAIFFLLSVYLILPQLVFVSYYNSEKYDVHIKNEYKDTGQMMDFGEASLQKMFRLRKDTINLNISEKDKYNASALINFFSYLFIILIIADVVFSKRQDENYKKQQCILLILAAAYLFFAAGPNPPLGFLYQRAVERFSLLAFLRTTAGATYFLSAFYVLLLFSFILNRKTIIKQSLASCLIIAAFCITGYPFLNGEFYKNVKVVVPTDTTKRGIIIPEDYFAIKNELDLIKTDVRLLFSNPEKSYIASNWGYFGCPFYDFLYDANNVDCKNLKDPLIYNMGFVLTDKSASYPQACSITTGEEDIIKKTDIIELSKVPDDQFIPHFYIPKNIKYSDFSEDNLKEVMNKEDGADKRLAIFSSDEDIAEKMQAPQIMPKITFIKINSTKYRIKVEGAKEPYVLAFLENFHDGWEIYIDDKADDQQYGDIVASYFGGEIKEGTHKNSFLDKNTLETWGRKPLSSDKHLLVNGYANSWIIDPGDAGGKENYELIVEFRPQQYFYLGAGISVITLLGCLGFAAYDLRRKKQNSKIIYRASSVDKKADEKN